MEEMEFEFPRAKKAVCERRSVVSVADAGVKSRKAGWWSAGVNRTERKSGGFLLMIWKNLQRNIYWRRKRKYRGMFWAFVCVRRKSVVRSKKATARSGIGTIISGYS